MSAESTTRPPLEAFRGIFPPTKIGLPYRVGLAIVALAMILLPLVYIALIVATGWAVVWHLLNDLWIFSGGSGRGMILRVILYLGPALIGAILVFFMIKPFFAAKAKAEETVHLDPNAEPLLFAFVAKICSLVGARVPSRIDVNCDVNASAGLARGLLSRDLVLTIGLPLVSGLNMRQFAGVLAHEFGHFAQGGGMRLTYVVRNINFWFSRVVYERDTWDVQLEQASRDTDWRIAVVLHAARGCVWFTRRILWVLMHLGHGISCFMLRQMEFDADSYEAKLSGSDTFESTAARLRVLGVATQVAYDDVRQSWAANRLPENLPLLIDHKADTLSQDAQQDLAAKAAEQKTGWFDTHPSDPDRVRHAASLNEKGVFRSEESSEALFSDYAKLSKQVTVHHYEKQFGLQFGENNLISSEEIVQESRASAEAEAMVRNYYGNVNVSLVPLLSPNGLPPVEDRAEAIERWRAARKETEELRQQAEATSNELAESFGRLASVTTAYTLAKAGFQVDPEEFGLPQSAKTAEVQSRAAKEAQGTIARGISSQLAELDPFMTALRRRVELALMLTPADPQSPNPDSTTGATDPATHDERSRLLGAVGAELPELRELGANLNAFMLLVQNRGNHAEPATVDRHATSLVAEIDSHVGVLQLRMSTFDYPFPHSRGRLSVAEYARGDEPADNDWQRAYQNGNAHVDRLFALHYRLLGKILAAANAAEARI